MVSRSRTTLAVVAVTAAVGLLAACSSAAPQDEPAPTGDAGTETEPADEPEPDADPATITFVAYGGAGQDAMIAAWQDPYTAKHPNISFVNTSPPDVAQVKAQVESGQVTWDVLATAPYAAEQNCDVLFEPLDLDLSAVNEADLVEGAVGSCYAGNFANSTPLAYRTDAFPAGQGPTKIADFFDVKNFPGQRGILTNMQNGILEYPLLADGVAPDDLYPLDVDRSLAKLDEIRSVTTFAPNVGALQQAVASDQVDIFLLSDSRLVAQLADGDDITVVWDVTVAAINAFAIPKGAPNKAAAEKFIASVLEPEQVASIAKLLGVAPVNLAAKLELDEFSSQLEVFGPANTGTTVMQDIPWYAENFNEISTKLTNWLAG